MRLSPDPFPIFEGGAVTLNLVRLQKRSGRLNVNTLSSPSPSPVLAVSLGLSLVLARALALALALALTRVSLIVSARNTSAVILYRPDHYLPGPFLPSPSPSSSPSPSPSPNPRKFNCERA